MRLYTIKESNSANEFNCTLDLRVPEPESPKPAKESRRKREKTPEDAYLYMKDLSKKKKGDLKVVEEVIEGETYLVIDPEAKKTVFLCKFCEAHTYASNKDNSFATKELLDEHEKTHAKAMEECKTM